MKGRFDFRQFRRRAILIALVASIVPSLALVLYSYRQAVIRAHTSLGAVAKTVRKRTDDLLFEADATLNRLAEDTRGATPADATKVLRRAVYTHIPYREVSIIDARGQLALTNMGPVTPPLPVTAEKRADMTTHDMQVLGAMRTTSSQENSVVLALPTEDNREIDILIHPSFFTLFLDEQAFGVDGFVAVLDRNGKVLSTAGSPPLNSGMLVQDKQENEWREEALASRAGVRVVAGVTRRWALRYWKEDMQVIAPLLLLYNIGLTLAVTLLVRQGQSLESDLHLALRRHEFEVRYLTVIDMQTGVCVGSEALLRWRHPTEGLLPPLRFIPFAEENGIIGPMTEWLLGQIMREQAPLLRRFPDLYVTVNVAPSHLAQDGFQERFSALSRSLKLPPKNFVLEITERGLLDETVGAVPDTMTFLGRDGLRWALDDFGTGHSSLSYLHRFPFDQLKIDRAFVRGIGEQTGAALSVLDALIDLGQKLNLTIIAEGVEKEVQSTYLQERGVQFAQGWLYCEPVPIEEFSNFLSQSRSKGAPE